MKNCLKKVWMLSVLLSLALLTACSDDNSNFYRVYPYDNGGGGGGVTVPEDEGGKYKEKEVRVNRGGTYDGQVTLRFYDAQPNVAYMSIAAFYRMMLPNATMKLEKQGGMYVLTTDNGKVVSQVAVNVYDDYLETLEDYSIIDFTNLMSINQQGMPNVYYDGAPFVKYKDLTATGASKSTTLNFKKYSIDLHGDASNVYFPFSTLSDMYADLAYHFAGYNGDHIVINVDATTTSTMQEVDKEFSKAVYAKETTPDDLAKFRYNELCFAIDNFFGWPGRSTFEPQLKEKGLDALLDAQGEEGKEVKKLLQSTKNIEFVVGMDALQWYMYDGGHTTMTLSHTPAVDDDNASKAYKDRCNATAAQYPRAKALIDKAEQANNVSMEIRKDVLAKRKKAFEAMGLTSDTKYIKKGETAFCVLDSFYDIDWKAWKAYYAGGEKPTLAKYPKDDLLILLDALQKAEEDPDVTNFVIDITANPGGSLDLVTTLTSLLADKTDTYAETTLTNQRYTATYVVDRNFDRVFDAKDKEVAYHLNIAVLTSAFSFSCGNLFPALMKGYGTLIIGEKSGGGACAIQQMCTADGFDYRISSFRCRLCDANGKNIDGGVEPQKALLRDQFYDLGVLEQNIVDYYHKK